MLRAVPAYAPSPAAKALAAVDSAWPTAMLPDPVASAPDPSAVALAAPAMALAPTAVPPALEFPVTLAPAPSAVAFATYSEPTLEPSPSATVLLPAAWLLRPIAMEPAPSGLVAP